MLYTPWEPREPHNHVFCTQAVKYSPGSLKALKTGATTGFALSLLTLCDKNAMNTPTALAGNRYVGYCQTEVQTLKEDVSPGEKP